VVLHLKDGQIEADILPPVTAAMKQRAQRTLAKFQEAFDEIKR
jgi:hypothetical protein